MTIFPVYPGQDKESRMSITIFAKGIIERINDIPALTSDMKEIAKERNWKYRIINDDWDVQPDAVLAPPVTGKPAGHIKGSLGLRGIVLNAATGAEPLSILFDRSGVLTDMFQQLAWIESNGQNERFTCCKTQFADIEEHIEIIDILDHLKKKYIPNLAVNDEGTYWETRDRRILAEKRIALNHYLRHAEKVISSIEFPDGGPKDADSIAASIEEALLKTDEEDRL
jgi:hypothetical protein